MSRKRFSAEQIIPKLREAEVEIARGATVGAAAKKIGVTEQTFYRWKKVYGGMPASEARELKQLRDENTKLKRLVADLSLDKVMLQDVVQKKF